MTRRQRVILLASMWWVSLVASFLWLSVMPASRGLAYADGDVTQDIPPVTAVELRHDVRSLPLVYAPEPPYRPLRRHPIRKIGAPADEFAGPALPAPPGPMPAAIQSFPGLSMTDLCGGPMCSTVWPPDPNGDVGLSHYIEAVNTSYAIYGKTGTLLASFTENALFSGTGNSPCNGKSVGDPIVLYDQQANRWILTHVAFAFNQAGRPVVPFYQCLAVSKTSDPVAGGWWLYPLRIDGSPGIPLGALNDYPKFGIWTDCFYMSADLYDTTSFVIPFIGALFASFNRANMYNGTLTGSTGFIPRSDPFTMIPSHIRGRGQSSQPASGTPNYYVAQSPTDFNFEVRRFTAGPDCGGGGTLSGPTNVSHASYTVPPGDDVPQPGTAITLDSIDDRLMQRVQYRRVGARESLWVTHNTKVSSTERPQWAQLDVTGGVVATTPVQEQIYAPDTTLNRWMSSIAADRQGNAALGYSTSNGTAPNFPSIAYAGRLATDPLNTLPQTEVQLIAGSGSQTNSCNGVACSRWGDYTAMNVDPIDDCTFWYTNQYYSSAVNGSTVNWQTRIGAFKFPSCRPLPVVCCRDFNGGGMADILWRDVSGTVAVWLINGTSVVSSAVAGAGSADGTIVAVGDFNGDGKSDILWRNSAGVLSIWLMNGASILGVGSPGTVSLDWTVQGAGDFNGDGKADILWRDDTGAVGIWFMNGTSSGSSAVVGTVPLDWTIWGIGDFNGDGKADILWRDQAGVVGVWLMNGTTVAASAVVAAVGSNWTIGGVGDFDGDGKADILWRDDAGTVGIWFMNGTSSGSSGLITTVPLNWTIGGVGDFDGNGKADILWRNQAGVVAIWLMNGTTIAASGSLGTVSTDWQVQ